MLWSTQTLLESFKQWLNGVLEQLAEQAGQLQQALSDRLLPLIEQLRPVWQDPLWQALALILLIVLLVFFAGWFIKVARQLFIGLFASLVAVGKKLFGWLLTPFGWIYRRFGKTKTRRPGRPRWQWLNLNQMRRAVNAMKYLTSKRDWRYNMPWFLLIGEHSSGKTSLINAVTQGRRVQLLPREKDLKQPGSGWHFFDHAVVIEVQNKQPDGYNEAIDAPTAKREMAADGAGHSTIAGTIDNEAQQTTTLTAEQYSQQFSNLIELLHWYRPERPVDGIILTVSAKSLLHASGPAALQALGETLFQQLWQSQKHSGFVLPVYLIVSQCDHVEGFSAYWQAQGSDRAEEMIGWSNPYRLDSAFTIDWVEQAFSQLLKNLEDAQLQVAAGGQKIGDIDRFMLFRRHFGTLQQPLTEVIGGAFARSAFQEALPLRGIYFCGRLDNQVAFVNQLMSRKIFAEKHLAFPLEKRRFSTQKTLRRFQFASLAGAVILLLLMAIDSYRLDHYNANTLDVLRRLTRLKQDCTAEGQGTYRLLSGLTEISDRPLLLSMPLSWLNTRGTAQRRLVADELLKKMLFDSLECRINIRAETLRVQTQGHDSNENYRMVINDIKRFGRLLVNFQLNRDRFLALAGPLSDTRGVGKGLEGLLKYLYDRPIPKSVDPDAQLITGAIQWLDYDVDWDEKGHELIGRADLLNHLDDLTGELYQALIEHVQQLPLADLHQLSQNIDAVAKDVELPPSPLLVNISEFQQWVLKTEQDWLSATSATSPCGNIHQLLGELRDTLVNAGFNELRLNAMVERFSQQQCDHQVRNRLAQLDVAPFGSMFERNVHKRLEPSPVLSRLTGQIAVLEGIGFVKRVYPPVSDSAEPVVAWHLAPLQELLTTLLEHQQRLGSQPRQAPSFFAAALESRLQQVTERLLSMAMERPSQQPPQSYLVDDPAAYAEAQLSQSVASFKAVSDTLLQIGSLLKQLGDNGNAIVLQQKAQLFVLQQLQQLQLLVAENQLYKPVASPHWDERNFARILFNLESEKQIEGYLTGQRQRIRFLAFSYAEPLLRFLQNSETGLSDKVARRWLTTLNDLARYQRNESNNELTLLDDFVSVTLAGLSNDNCHQQAAFDAKSGVNSDGWFALRRLQLQRQVSVQCQDAGDNKTINRYLAIRQHFNRELAGRFPFAPVAKAGINDLSGRKLRRFLQYYRRAAKNLLPGMLAVDSYQPGSVPTSWRDFISQMDNLSEFFKNSWVVKQQQWQLPLNVEFSALSRYANGTNQIINWTLDSGQQQISYPNDGTTLNWQVGDPLKLDLRWASGSAFVPFKQPGTAADAPLQIDPQQLTASFSSRGRWGLFEWLARYGSNEASGFNAAREDERLLAFHVPVIVKDAFSPGIAADDRLPLPRVQAYVSRSNLLLWVEYINADGDKDRLALPGVLPVFAPGFVDP